MNNRNRIGTIIATLLIASIASLSGCATTGMQRSEQADTSMKTVETDIRNALVQLDVTASSLESLINPNQSDLKKAFNKYSDDIEKMDDLGKRLNNHADKMSAQGAKYFEEWRKEGDKYTNPEIQVLSEQRRAEMTSELAKVSDASIGVKGAYKAYMTDNKEIKTYLSNDLTPKGIESITPTAQKSVMNGNSLKEAVKPVLSAIDNARAELSHGGNK